MKVALMLNDKIIKRYNNITKIYVRKCSIVMGHITLLETGEKVNDTIIVPYDFTKVGGYSI